MIILINIIIKEINKLCIWIEYVHRVINFLISFTRVEAKYFNYEQMGPLFA